MSRRVAARRMAACRGAMPGPAGCVSGPGRMPGCARAAVVAQQPKEVKEDDAGRKDGAADEELQQSAGIEHLPRKRNGQDEQANGQGRKEDSPGTVHRQPAVTLGRTDSMSIDPSLGASPGNI